MWKIVIEDDEAKRTTVPLSRDEYTIGRKEGNSIRLTERNVSREHARIERRPAAPATDGGVKSGGDGGYTLVDLRSYNGVYVNGLRVSDPHPLLNGDLVQIGDYRLFIQDDQADEVSDSAPTIDDGKTTIPAGTLNRASLALEKPNRLVMLAGPTPGAEFPLEGDKLTIGRAEEATISVNHNSVSRLHCEVHALGDQRFEIVDRGSSNGVRVNGADLRQGIIEAGDVIELGDVRFKFVGAGQVFRPGVNDTQQLSALTDRAGPRRGVTTYLVIGALIAGACVVVYAYTRPQSLASIAPTPDVASSAVPVATAAATPSPAAATETASAPATPTPTSDMVRSDAPPARPAAIAATTRDVAPPSPRRSNGDAPPAAATAAPQGATSPYERASLQVKANNPEGAKDILMPRVLSGTATPEETRFLRGICRGLHNQVCVEKCNSVLKE